MVNEMDISRFTGFNTDPLGYFMLCLSAMFKVNFQIIHPKLLNISCVVAET